MVFREHTYGVLVVSSSEKFNSTMKTLLPMTDYWPLDFAGSVSEARRRMLETEYDLVLINAPLPDDFGTRLATSICNETGLGVLLFVKAAMYDDVCSKVTEYGVLTVSKPAPLQVVRPVAERALRHAGAAAPHGGAPGLRGGEDRGDPPREPRQVATHRAARHDGG